MLNLYVIIALISYVVWICSGLNGAIMNAIFFLLIGILNNTTRG